MTIEGPTPILCKPSLPKAGAAGGLAAVPAGLPRISVVIPVLNEAGNIGAVLDELDDVLRGRVEFDVVVVDDGSSDDTGEVVAQRAGRIPGLALVRHSRRAGQSAGLRSGARIARSEWLITMDGDGQYDPNDIHGLIAAVESASEPLPALIFGIRSSRRDSWAKRLASRFANGLRRWMLRDGCPDTGCGLKLINRDVFLSLPFFAGLHRFLPALVQGYGYRVVGVAVSHRPRRAGTSKYTNVGRALVGIFDLFGAMWLIRRTPRPAARSVPMDHQAVDEIAERNRVGSR